MRYLPGEQQHLPGHGTQLAGYQGRHFKYELDGKAAMITLNRPERKNPLTFDSYAELRELFRAMAYAVDIKAIVLTGAGGNFCSGGDVHEIIGPLTKLGMPGLLTFTRMTGRRPRKPIERRRSLRSATHRRDEGAHAVGDGEISRN